MDFVCLFVFCYSPTRITRKQTTNLSKLTGR